MTAWSPARSTTSYSGAPRREPTRRSPPRRCRPGTGRCSMWPAAAGSSPPPPTATPTGRSCSPTARWPCSSAPVGALVPPRLRSTSCKPICSTCPSPPAPLRPWPATGRCTSSTTCPRRCWRERAQLAPGGALYVTSLVAETPIAARYLALLHRAGEVATPRRQADLLATARAELGDVTARRHGAMCFLTART